MPQIVINVDSDMKNASISINDNVIPNVSSVGYCQYDHCDCETGEEYQVTEVYISTIHKGDGGFSASQSFNWRWTDKENSEVEYSEQKDTPVKAILNGVLDSRTKSK